MLKVQTKIFNVGTAAEANTSSSVSGEGLDSGTEKVKWVTLSGLRKEPRLAELSHLFDAFEPMLSHNSFALRGELPSVIVYGYDWLTYESQLHFIVCEMMQQKIKEICSKKS